MREGDLNRHKPGGELLWEVGGNREGDERPGRYQDGRVEGVSDHVDCRWISQPLGHWIRKARDLPCMSTSLQPPSISFSNGHSSNRSTAVTLGVYSISCSAWFVFSPSWNSSQEADPATGASTWVLFRQYQTSFSELPSGRESRMMRLESWTDAEDGGDGHGFRSF